MRLPVKGRVGRGQREADGWHAEDMVPSGAWQESVAEGKTCAFVNSAMTRLTGLPAVVRISMRRKRWRPKEAAVRSRAGKQSAGTISDNVPP